MRLKVFSKLDCCLKLEFQPKIEFLKLDLHLTWIFFFFKKKKKSETRV